MALSCNPRTWGRGWSILESRAACAGSETFPQKLRQSLTACDREATREVACLNNVAAQFSCLSQRSPSVAGVTEPTLLISIVWAATLPALTKVPWCTHWSQQRTAEAQPPEALLAWSAIVLQEELESAVLKLLTVQLLLFF